MGIEWRRDSRWGRAGLCASACVVSGLAGWIVLGRWADRPTVYHERADRAYRLRFVNSGGEMLSARDGPFALMADPLTLYRNFPRQRNACITIDEHGFRGPRPDPTKPWIMLVGGSSAFGFGMDGDADTLAARLDPHRPEETVVNAAVIGYTAAQELSLAVHHLDRHRPAAYVALNGFNDFVDTLSKHETLGVNGEFFGMVARLRAHHLATSPEGDGPDGARFVRPPPGAKPHAVLVRYVRAVERLHAWAKGRGAVYVVAIQPYLGCRETMTAAERALPVDPRVARNYTRFAANAALAFKALRIPCINLHADPRIKRANESVFLDPIHLSADGNALVARCLAARLDTVALP